jgi:DegV family protein with EDD domain
MEISTAVVTDSLACLTPELAAKYAINIVPLSFMLQGKIYRDWIDLEPTKAYELFLQDPDSFQSSAPSPIDFINSFRDASRKASKIVCITLSSKLSTTYNTALIAKEQLTEELPETKIKIIDSMTTTAAEGMIVLAAARAAAEGKDFDDVVQSAVDIRGRVKFYAFLDTIRHVYRSGRIPKIASQIGSVLHVKPILSIFPENDGLVKFNGIVRSRQNGIDRMIKMIKDEVGDKPIRMAVMHAYALKEAQELQKEAVKIFNCQEIWLTEFSPLMGYATGTGTLGLAFHLV